MRADPFAVGGMMVSTNVAFIAGYLTLTRVMICMGGQVSLMITGCVEGLFSPLAHLIIVFVIFSVVSWQQMADGHRPALAPYVEGRLPAKRVPNPSARVGSVLTQVSPDNSRVTSKEGAREGARDLT